MLRTLLRYFRPHIKLFLLDMFCAVLAAAIDLAFPMVSRHVMYTLLPDRLFHAFFAVMAAVFVCYALRSVCFYVMTYWGHTFGIRVETDIRADLFPQLQELDFEFYDQMRTGNLMSRLTGDLFEVTELAHHGPEDLLISVLTVVGSLTIMFTVEWRLALVVSVLIPIFLIITMMQRRNMSKTSTNVKKKLAGINTDIETSLSGMKTSKAFANEAVDNSRFTDANNQYRGAKKDFYRAMGIFNASQEFFMGILPAVVIAAGGWLIMKDQMNYIDLITFTLFVSSFVTPIRKMAQFAEIFTSGMAGLRRFEEVMAMQPTLQEKPGAQALVIDKGNVDIDHVSFSYVHNPEVLHDIDLHVKGGEMIAVVGASGGGKTTLCQLIPRFYDVTDGQILIDGHDIRDVKISSLREQIGIVPQETMLFSTTVRENIRYGRLDATDEEVVEAAKAANADEFIRQLPKGYDTQIGERGLNLSGGQRQRMAIARAILKNPRILILDEATSALDTESEKIVQAALDKLMEGRTSFVIAHRLSTIFDADQIFVIDHGHVKEQGTHEELLALGGLYSYLYSIQFKNAEAQG